MPETTGLDVSERGSLAVALLRITLGVIIVVTWYKNLTDDLYTGDGIEGLINWLYSPDGNNSSLTWYQSLLENTILKFSGLFAVLQAVVELAIGVGLLLGVATRAAAIGAAVFFASLFLAYFGGDEWIWTYVILFMSAVTVFLGWGGRALGVDQFLSQRFGRSPAGLVW